MEHRVSRAIFHAHEMTDDNTLHVVAVISNHAQYHSRYRLAREFIREMKATPCVKLHLVELAHGHHKHELAADMIGESYLPLRSHHGHLWLKEALVNAGVRYLLPNDWKYMAWVDADIHFRDPEWAKISIQRLQDYEVIQPWATCVDIGAHGQALLNHESFASILNSGLPMKSTWDANYKYCHTGFAWACRRSFWEALAGQGLMSFNLVGSGDHHRGWALINRAHDSVHGKMSDGFKRMVDQWARLAYRKCNGHVGVVQTRIEHHFHGSKQKRYYRERWQIFVSAAFDPYKDLCYDEWGLPYIVGKPGLDEEIRRYNFSRQEDQSTDS